MSQVYTKTKKPCERERRKPLVTLWLVNATKLYVTQVLPVVKRLSFGRVRDNPNFKNILLLRTRLVLKHEGCVL